MVNIYLMFYLGKSALSAVHGRVRQQFFRQPVGRRRSLFFLNLVLLGYRIR